MPPLNKHVLWVEDDQDNRQMVTFILEQAGYRVTSAETSVEALGLAQSENFDLYLLGDWLPHGKESRLCEQILEIAPQSPILFFSAAAYQTDRRRGMEAGALGYLTKPGDFADLTRSVACLLSEATGDIQVALRAVTDRAKKGEEEDG
jgi:DNA-binding response OmpR family regulator